MNKERCDACSAMSQFEVTLSSGKNIYLCGHHARRHMDALVAQNAVLLETWSLDADIEADSLDHESKPN
jgi:hypothetical protein